MINHPEPPVIPFSEIVDRDGEYIEFGVIDDTSDDNLRCEALLGVLRKRQRQVAVLMIEGYHPAEIAKRLGVSKWAVYRITLRIRDKLIELGGVRAYGRRRY